MPTPPALPTILLIQGSFQTPLVYSALTTLLRSRGYTVHHPSLPSCTDPSAPDFPSKTIDSDTAVVRSLLERLVNDEDLTVVVVMHSYGGLVGSNAVSRELSYGKRGEEGKKGGVVHLFYFAAFILEEGKSVLGSFGESENNDVRDDGRFCLKSGVQLLYSDLLAADATMWESRMIPQSHAVQSTKISCEGWRYVPSTYLVCGQDKAVAPRYQEVFAGVAGARVRRCEAGHSPMLSWTEGLVGEILGGHLIYHLNSCYTSALGTHARSGAVGGARSSDNRWR
ncbi:catalytic protein [Ophiobolus disseminans]|uniref:Catalytic protein n=1 Tax=Ophiobolus disseminans TaxID=1469910 RepID=A0A6A7A0Z2_9PLEO|nr:catalytic protein [Ophiobolus disseminans]